VKECFVQDITFGPDGKTLAAGYFGGDSPGDDARDDGGVVLWDGATRHRLTQEPLPVDEDFTFSVAFSPDGKSLGAAYYGVGPRHGVEVWDVATRQRLAQEPLRVSEGRVHGVAFSPDGKTLAAGYSDRDYSGGGVVLWDVDLDSWQRRAGRIANRNFTWEEWRQYFPDEPYRTTFPELPVPLDVPANDGARNR
jgi:WD40 repeat protein